MVNFTRTIAFTFACIAADGPRRRAGPGGDPVAMMGTMMGEVAGEVAGVTAGEMGARSGG
jgi:hypothetical protein